MQSTVEIKLGLESITSLSDRLGKPQDDLKIIHVAGTNGKGSVVQMLSSSLQQAGYTIGVFTSPHLIDVKECIQINNKLITDQDYTLYMNRIEQEIQYLNAQNIQVSSFETLTALALLYFKECHVDFVILEVGLGGRLDATNVINHSIASIITKISIDHQDYLGTNLSSIASEKAGIIKRNGLVITSLQEDSVNSAIEQKCVEQNAQVVCMNPKDLQVDHLTEEGTWFTYKNKLYHTKLIGEHQAYNASLAITALYTLKEKDLIDITEHQIEQGLSQTSWPGRFEQLSTAPRVFIDGGHNVDGIHALSSTLEKLPQRYTIGIIGILKDKEVSDILTTINEQIDMWVVTEPDNLRALPKEELASMLSSFNKPIYMPSSIADAVNLATSKASEIQNCQIIGFGSLYMIGSIRQLFTT